MFYQGGNPWPLSHHITSSRKGIPKDMLGFISLLFYICYCFNCF